MLVFFVGVLVVDFNWNLEGKGVRLRLFIKVSFLGIEWSVEG